MDWSLVRDIATALLSGSWFAILVTAIIALSLPVLLHVLLYRSQGTARSNDFILLGPSGSGKTALCSLLERKSARAAKPPRGTHTSQEPAYFSAVIPPTVKTASDRFRSVNDPALAEASKNPVRYRIYDTPGHGKLRSAHGMAKLSSMSDTKAPKTNARGIMYMLDAATLTENEFLSDTVAYLHDILMVLQQRVQKGSKHIASIPVLIAANKLDLFTALPADAVKDKLEKEIERYRQSKKRGLLDPTLNPAGDDEPQVLGGDEGHGQFSFKVLEEETGVTVDVIGGAVKSDDAANPAAGVQRWEEWVASCL